MNQRNNLNKYSVSHTKVDVGAGTPSVSIHDFLTKEHNCLKFIIERSFVCVNKQLDSELTRDILVNYFHEALDNIYDE